jgi:hypothetical protein
VRERVTNHNVRQSTSERWLHLMQGDNEGRPARICSVAVSQEIMTGFTRAAPPTSLHANEIYFFVGGGKYFSAICSYCVSSSSFSTFLTQ